MTRVLIAARLSRNAGAEQASRIERDDLQAREWAEANTRVVVDTSEDRNVSGKTDPFKRPSLGPWLTKPELIDSYDEIVASSIDRLARNAWELFRLREWAKTNGKKLTILSPPLTWPAAPDDFASPIMWDLLGRLAEIERSMIAKRIADSQATIRENQALIGKEPFGFEIEGDRYHKTLALDPRLVPYLRDMVAKAMKNEPLHAIARWLDAEGVIPVTLRDKVPEGVRQEVLGPPLKAKWSTVSVRRVLHSPALKGRRLDADGKVLVKHEGILTSGQWDALQAQLASRPNKRGPTKNDSAMLTGSILCALCGSPMYRKPCPTTHKNGTIHINTYYRCDGKNQERSRCKNMIPLSAVDDYVNAWFTEVGAFASTEIVERISLPGDDHRAE
ncbi:MAG: recombinase family protein, partial [Acidimicrobiales bacterium]